LKFRQTSSSVFNTILYACKIMKSNEIRYFYLAFVKLEVLESKAMVIKLHDLGGVG
jgi:hypothetical protein